jgi:glyoxylase-like metal-dependent hydrolase (beta-lactamase superfamily II)
MGIRKDLENLPPNFLAILQKYNQNIRVEKDAAERIADGGLEPSKIKTVVISHAHFDHTGDPSRLPSATVIVGQGTYDLVQRGYPADPDSHYTQDTLPKNRTHVLDLVTGWETVGPFPRALDLFGDGSAYILDAPGHISGHINLLARTSPDGAWACFTGDAFHHWHLVTGEARIAGKNGGGYCAHDDVAEAEATISRIRELGKIPRVRTLPAHDIEFWKKGEGFWPDTIPSL